MEIEAIVAFAYAFIAVLILIATLIPLILSFVLKAKTLSVAYPLPGQPAADVMRDPQRYRGNGSVSTQQICRVALPTPTGLPSPWPRSGASRSAWWGMGV